MTPQMTWVLALYGLIAMFIMAAMLHDMRDEPLRMPWLIAAFALLWPALVVAAVLSKLALMILEPVIEWMDRRGNGGGSG
jgi:hypothetical protein